jgi:adenylate cyclase
LLERPELMAYDHFVWQRARAQPAADSHIVICGMTEEDLVKYGHPLDDAKFADLLEKIGAAGACVIGVDIYRDLPEPRSGESYPQLEKTLRRMENVIVIERVDTSIKPPPALADAPDRVAPNNFPSDSDDISRRAYLFLENGLAEARESFALALARTYLIQHNVEVKLVEAPGSTAPLLQLGRTVFPRITSNAGAYSGLDVADYEILVDYRAPLVADQSAPKHYANVSFGDVLENRADTKILKDAIVIVGVMTPSVKDYNPTPVDSGLRGAVHHAVIINQLLRSALDGEKPTGWWPEPARVAWIAFWTFLGGALGLVIRSPWKLAPALALLLGAIYLAGREALFHSLWIPTTTPALGAFAAATFATSLIVFLESADRRAMGALFSRHVSKDVMEVLWAERDQFLDGGRLKPQRITATVLFTDLKDYSTISEDMDPADLMNWINEYMNRIAPLVTKHGGTVNSYSGDAIMAVFGAPFAHTREEEIDRDASRAVECALAMRKELKSLNAEWAARGLPTVAMRVGIYTGPVVTGSIGSQERLEYSVLGDTTNIAARLESLGREWEDDPTTTPCIILIGDSTCHRLHGRFQTKPVGSKRLKGKAKEVIVHSVLSAVP